MTDRSGTSRAARLAVDVGCLRGGSAGVLGGVQRHVVGYAVLVQPAAASRAPSPALLKVQMQPGFSRQPAHASQFRHQGHGVMHTAAGRELTCTSHCCGGSALHQCL